MDKYITKEYEFWVHPDTRDFIKSTYNLTDKDTGDFKLLQYVLFYPKFYLDEDDNHDYSRIIVPRNLVCSFYNKLRDGNVVSLFKEFSEKTGITLNLTPYEVHNNKCRTITPDFSSEVLDRVDAERKMSTQPKHGKVLFTTGESYTTYTVNKKRKQRREAIMNRELDTTHPAYELLQELHSPRTLKKLATLITSNEEWVAKYLGEEPEGPRRNLFSAVYSLLETQPYIEYGYADKTSRIHAQGYSLFQLPGDLRDAVLSGPNIYGLDFCSSQFTIISHLWNVESGKEFLRSGKKLWVELCTYSGVPYERYMKPQLKEYFYGLFYGMSKKKRKALLMALFGNTKLESHPMIREFLSSRRRQVKLIVKAMGVHDGFGTWLPITRSKFNPNSTPQERAGYLRRINKEASDLLCVVAQSVELKIMLGLFRELRANKNLRLIAFLHDGLIFQVVHNHEHLESYKARLSAVVTAEASRLLMPLDVEFVDMTNPATAFASAVESQQRYIESLQNP